MNVFFGRRLRKLLAYISKSKLSWLVFIFILGLASLICALLRITTESDVHVPLIFVLAVLLVALLTEGYFYGVLAALLSVIAVNYAFTRPYYDLDFSSYGYPLTFVTMLAVGCAVSTLISRLKAQEHLRIESEREKMRANLLRAISHDLRTPLTAISGSIATVLDQSETLSPQQKSELLLDAKKDADWLCRMVENLLSITRMSGETGSIVKEDELLEEVLSEAAQSFKKRHEDVLLSVSVPVEVLVVPMDAMLIEQVLLNLMDNAVTHGCSKHIRVTATSGEKEAVISVVDDGCGIDRQLVPHLFDGSLPLSNKGQSDKNRGMGIGLSVCRTIVEAHGGCISAENLPEGGAKFSFTLPYEGESHDNKG